MTRPTRCRRICIEPAYDSFFPDGVLTGEEVIMTLDEYETIRLIDLRTGITALERGGKHPHMQKPPQEVRAAQLPLPGTHCPQDEE